MESVSGGSEIFFSMTKYVSTSVIVMVFWWEKGLSGVTEIKKIVESG